MIGLVIVIFFVARKIYRMEFPITKTNFSDITLGMATSKNIDISQLIIWYVFFAVLLSLLFAYLFHKRGYYDIIKTKIKSCDLRENDNFFIGVMILGQILLGGRHALSITYVLSLILGLIYLHKANPQVDKKTILSIWVTAIWVFSIPCILIGEHFNPIGIFASFSIFSLLYLCHLSRKEDFSLQIHAKLFPFLLAAVSSYMMLAVMEILLIRGNDVNAAYAILPFLLALSYSLLCRKYGTLDYGKLNFYGTIILMILSNLPIMGVSYPLDFFEGANHGISIEEFILGMGLPLFHNLDAHMLYVTLSGLIYYYLTGDYTGAIFIPYFNIIKYTIGIASVVYLFKHYFSKQEILIMLMLLPWPLFCYPSYIGFIIFAAFVLWKKKQGTCQSLMLIAAFALLSLYRIDLGASFGLAAILCPIFYSLGHKKYAALARYIMTCALFCLCSGLIIYLIALHYSIDITVTMQSFLTAFSSNQHWAFGKLGSSTNVWWSYFLLPLAVSVMILPYMQRLMQGKESSLDWIALFLYCAFVFNIPRILARHTLVENQVSSCSIILVLAGLLFISGLKNNRASIFALVFLAGSFSILGFQPTAITGNNITNVHHLVHSISANEHTSVKLHPSDAEQINAYRNFFDANLSEEETYFDFTNQSLFYAFTHRQNPIYVNQSPGMINGYKGQEQAIASLEEVQPKFVTMPYRPRPNNLSYNLNFSIDGILNFDRFYLLTDYIVKNYRPYCAVGNFAVWCKKSDYDALCRRDIAEGIKREYLDYTYEPEKAHQHALGAIPSLWGNCDIPITSSKKLNPIGKQRYLLTDIDILGHSGFITIEIETPSKEEILCQINGNDLFPIEYRFKAEKGRHKYRLLVSSDILWYSNKLNEFVIKNANIQVNDIYFEALPDNL